MPCDAVVVCFLDDRPRVSERKLTLINGLRAAAMALAFDRAMVAWAAESPDRVMPSVPRRLPEAGGSDGWRP